MDAIIVLLFLLSILIVLKGADWFIESAISISNKLGIPKIIIGATIVSFATVAPEFFVSTIAAYLGHTEMTVGNALGSVICNTGLILGFVIAVRSRSPIENKFYMKSFFMVIAVLMLILFSYNGVITAFNGLFLLFLFIGFIYYNYKYQTNIWNDENASTNRNKLVHIRKELIYFVLGAIFVIIGSRLLVYSGVELAEIIGVPEMIIALTLVAFGTSAPELVTAIAAVVKKHHDLSIGNIIGANLMGLTLIFGVAPFFRDIPILAQSLYYDIPAMFVLIFVVVIPALVLKRLERWMGILLIILYIGYILGLIMWYV